MKRIILLVSCLCILAGIVWADGTVVYDTLYSAALQGDRGVMVYLPEGYDPANEDRRYPTIFCLNPYWNHAGWFADMFNLLDFYIEHGQIEPIIAVIPDSEGDEDHTLHMYSNSATYGNFEDYIVEDVVTYVDANYHTETSRELRALFGIFNGACGAFSLSLKHPDLFGSAASARGFLHFKSWLDYLYLWNTYEHEGQFVFDPDLTTSARSLWRFCREFFPNPDLPPWFIDFPYQEDGALIDTVVSRCFHHDPYHLLDSVTVENCPYLYFDCSWYDMLGAGNERFSYRLNLLGIPHTFYFHSGTASGEIDAVAPGALHALDSLFAQYRPHALSAMVNPGYGIPGQDTVTILLQVENQVNHDLALDVIITSELEDFVDTLALFDDGLHGDGDADDNQWGNRLAVPVLEERFLIDAYLEDRTDGRTRTSEAITAFTSSGPLSVEAMEITSAGLPPWRGQEIQFTTPIYNHSTQNYAFDTFIRLTSLDDAVQFNNGTNQSYRYLQPIPYTYTGRPLTPFTVMVDGDIPDTAQVPFLAEIGFLFYTCWTDTVYLDLGSLDVDDTKETLPEAYAVSTPYPNPFNAATTVQINLPEAGIVEIRVFDVLGRELDNVFSGSMTAGIHTVSLSGENWASGMYLLRVHSDGHADQWRKLVLLK